jgi:nitrate reductase delta subunit
MEKLLEALALALDYPLPGRLEALWRLWIECPRSGPKQKLERFLRPGGGPLLGGVGGALHPHPGPHPHHRPYVGFAVYGESYQRGEFLAALTRAFREEGVDPGSELPDHLANVLATWPGPRTRFPSWWRSYPRPSPPCTRP